MVICSWLYSAEIAELLSEIVNMSFDLKFPAGCQIAKVRCIFYKGKRQPMNYRPVWLLPVKSKVIEETWNYFWLTI